MLRAERGENIVGSILLFHGMTSTPSELRSLTDALTSDGHKIICPVLPGHEGADAIRKLRQTPLSTYLHFAEDSFRRIEGEAVTVIGLSFGALLALHLAEHFPHRVPRLVLLSPPLLFRRVFEEVGLRILSYATAIPGLGERFLEALPVVKKSARHAANFAFERTCLPVHSVGAGARVFALRRRVLRDLYKVEATTLSIHDPFDHLISPGAVRRLSPLTARGLLQQVLIAGGEHELAIGPRHSDVASVVCAFVKDV